MNIIPATPAPNFKGIEKWSDGLSHFIKDYKGKVILLDFWTYTCIFCLRSIPTIDKLKEKYQSAGLEIVSLHSAEYQFAKKEENIRKAIKTYGLEKFITGFDINNKTWEAYGNSYWPKHILIDRDGFVRYEHAGYGTAEDFEDAINELLEITDSKSKSGPNNLEQNSSDMKANINDNKGADPKSMESSLEYNRIIRQYGMHFPGMAPEICVGYSRMRRFGNNQKLKIDEFNIFNDLPIIMDNVVYLKGKWIWEREGIGVSLDHKDKLPSIVFKYNSASNVNIIAGSTNGKITSAEIKLDGEYLKNDQLGHDSKIDGNASKVDIDWPHIMNIVKTKEPSIHTLEIIPKVDNFYFYTFVFG